MQCGEFLVVVGLKVPRVINGYACITCQTFYSKEEEAYGCEAAHPPKENFSITHFGFGKLDHTWGLSRELTQKVPKSLTVRFGPEFGQFAVYKLDQIGPKGM